MKIIIFTFLFFLSPMDHSIKQKIMDLKIDKKEDIEIYHPIDEDYKFWTEEKNFNKILLDTKSFSINKYYSHNFFKKDDFGSFYYKNGKELLIPNRKNNENIYFSNPRKMLFFEDYFLSREKIQYFDVKTPTSEILYAKNYSFQDSFKEKMLEVFFSQSPNEETNYSIEYRNIYSIRYSPFFDKSKNLFITTFNYQDHNNDRYKLWGHYIFQKFSFKEKEKIVKWNINNTIFFDKNQFTYQRFYINFVQKIFERDKDKFFSLKTYIEYDKYHKDRILSYQNNIIHHFHSRNGLFLIFFRKKFNMEIGGILDTINYQLFFINEYNMRIVPKNKNIKNFSIETKINYPINDIFEFHSNAKWIIDHDHHLTLLTGPIFYIHGNIMLKNIFLFPKSRLLTQFIIAKNMTNTDIISLYILKKNKDCYNNKRINTLLFNQEKTIDFSFFYDKNYHMSFSVSEYSFKDNDEKEKIEDFFYHKNIQLYKLKLKTIHEYWKFQLHNIFLYQKYNSDTFIFSIPNFLSRNTIYFKDNYFNKSLSMQTGFSVHYFSNFYHQDIIYPFDLHIFSSEKECIPNQIGGDFLFNYFLNFKIYRTILYFELKNVGNLSKKDNDFLIKMGLLWNLFT
ncbi:putative porin [Blattabacterium cuenoti]|uniref:putative porin n=1 Tax=Blattabacterium cuenoti TaxID=1653831 RepID=UPI00163CED00|nr:putative porin [Blattabacterium cuenoti]